MRISSLIIIAALAGVISSCKTSDKDTAEQPFFPFPQYLEGQLAYLDTLPLAIEKTVKVNGITVDSVFLSKQLFRQEVSPWMEKDPNSEEMKPHFQETSFRDLTLNTITFSITAKDTVPALRQADILLEPESMKVKTLMLNFNFLRGDSSITRNIFWENNRKCQVAEEIAVPGKQPLLRVTRYVWDQPLSE